MDSLLPDLKKIAEEEEERLFQLEQQHASKKTSSRKEKG
jgi:hypothetical protein